jgi:hypothetical protein
MIRLGGARMQRGHPHEREVLDGKKHCDLLRRDGE